ncbi:MAG: D-alanyl-D-alanine carboxypeptidase, partial [Ottowia sp.]|nr:D-alanyl-D-alanine carboxypeptidase [Ottowia sp.]
MPVQAAVKKSAPVTAKAGKKGDVKAAKKTSAKPAKKTNAKAGKGSKAKVALRGQHSKKGKRGKAVAAAPVRRSVASALPRTVTPMELSASVAYVLDQDTHEVLLSRNESAVLPIASITKLMTGLLIADANLPMGEFITITQEDVDTVKGSSSRLPVGTTL